VRYRDDAHQDLVPALGQVRLNKLFYAHIAGFIGDQVAAGHGRTSAVEPHPPRPTVRLHGTPNLADAFFQI
jgi:hypothetical protein